MTFMGLYITIVSLLNPILGYRANTREKVRFFPAMGKIVTPVLHGV